jgi:uncharacterized protein (DUF2384 family)
MIGYSSDFQKAFWVGLEVYKAALDVWKTEEATKDFMTRAHMELGLKSPLTRALESKKGLSEVLAVIGKLKHSSTV